MPGTAIRARVPLHSIVLARPGRDRGAEGAVQEVARVWTDSVETRPTRTQRWLAAVVLSATLGAASAQELCPEPTPPELPRPDAPVAMPEDLRIGLFNTVWQTVHDFYLFEDFNGVDWEGVSREFAPHVLETENAWEFYDLLDRMVGTLDDPLTTFVNPLVLEAIATQEASYGGIGALLDRGAVTHRGEVLRVVSVFPGSPAEAEGLRPRDRILEVDGDDCPRTEIIRGPEGTTVRLLVVSPGEAPRELEIERATLEARILPEARRIGPDAAYAYLRLVSLAGEETVRGIEEAMDAFAAQPGLTGVILDVRGTRGGAPGVLLALLSYFLEGEVGAFYARGSESPIEVTPVSLKPGFDAVPVAVLVDSASVAEAEQLAALLQANGRARVVGQATSGETFGVRSLDFLGGSRLQLTVIGLQLPDGSALERVGVTPDVVVEGDWAEFREEEDPYLLAAIELLEAARGAAGGE
jgi:carboxyl-terminal processing protease